MERDQAADDANVVPQFGDTHVYLKGTATNLKPGDAILFVGSEREQVSGSERWDFRRVTKVIADFDANRTRVEWAEGLGTTSPHLVLPSANPKVYALRVRASLFGFNAPHPLTLSNDVRSHYGFTARQRLDALRSPDRRLISTRPIPAFLPTAGLFFPNRTYQELYRATSVIEAARAEFHACRQDNAHRPRHK